MTEAERTSFFAHSTQRAPGKRQIKPTAAMEQLVLPADEDEDDEDFKAELSGSGSEESESESSEESSDGDEEKEAGENDDDADYLAALKERREEEENEAPLCSLCLNLRPAIIREEVIQCDKCGVAVHESCYGVDAEGAGAGDDNSNDSASITEPWFCEPCVYGEKEPPHCELCPSRHGALKRSDIGGRWVHVLCALYAPGITFGDVERLSAISWQEIDYKQFGKKPCSGCPDRLESRTGIVIECDAALCKNYYHPTCAQRLGLLIDRSDEMNDDDGEYHDERFIHCKKHSHEEEVRRKREAYQSFLRQEERRFASMLKRKRLNEREEEKRVKMEEKCRARCKKMDGVTVSMPDATWDKSDKKSRRARQLHTSARYLEAFSNKAELVGVARDEFEKAFIKVDGRSLSFLPPAFSPEFITYFHHREKHVMAAETLRLERVTKERDVMREEQEKREKKYHTLENDHKKSEAAVEEAQQRLAKVHSLLVRLGAKKLPKIADIFRKDSTAATPRSRVMSRSSLTGTSILPSALLPSPTRRPLPTNVMKSCATCTTIKDQHLLVECDACHKHYHLQCLEPPLERMPKKRNCEWHCSECAPESTDEEGAVNKEETPDVEEEDSNGARKLRHRSDSLKKKKQEEKEQETRDYRSAMLRGSGPKRVSKPNKRYSTDTPPPTLTSSHNHHAHPPPPHLSREPMVLPHRASLTPHSPDEGPPTKRGRGRPRKTPSLTNSPEKNGRISMERASMSSRRSQPSLSPQGMRGAPLKSNGRSHHETLENEEDEDAMEDFIIVKE